MDKTFAASSRMSRAWATLLSLRRACLDRIDFSTSCQLGDPADRPLRDCFGAGESGYRHNRTGNQIKQRRFKARFRERGFPEIDAGGIATGLGVRSLNQRSGGSKSTFPETRRE